MKNSNPLFKLKTLALACAAALPVASVPLAVQAQEQQIQLEEVIVTARKRQESLQDVPVTVTAIGRQLQNSAVQNLKDLQNFVPNVSIDSTPASTSASISIRGISFQEPDKSLDPPVGVILDGVYIGTAAGQILNNFDIERIEVLRGPQGTLFGKNTIGGAINVIRTAPTKEFGGKVQLGVGDWDKQEIKAVINTPLTDTGGLKLYANKSEHDGYMENDVADTDVGVVDFQQLGATVAFDITDSFNVALTVERIEDDSDWGAWSNFNDATTVPCLLSGGAVCFGTDPNSGEDNSSMNAPNSAEVTNDFVSLTMNWLIGDWQLTSITGTVDREEDARLEYDSSSVEFLYILSASEYEQFSQEFRINGNINDNMNVTAGLYYWDSEYKQTQTGFDMWFYIPIDLGFGAGEEFLFGADGMSPIPQIGFPGWAPLPPGDVTQTLNNKGTNTAYSAFASLDWKLTDQLTLNLGGRYTDEEKTYAAGNAGWVSASQPLVNLFFADGEVQTFKDDWQEFSPRVALQYTLTDDLMFFGSYAKGFKSGGYFARSTQVDGNAFDPETVETIELGMKSEWLDKRLRLNVTAFMSDYKDKQEEVLIQEQLSANTVVRNASDVEIQGLELELTAQVSSGLGVYMNVGYLDSEYSDFVADISGDGIATDNSGLQLRNAPEKTIAVGADYVTDVSVGELGLHYNYRWADEYQTVFRNHPLGKVDSQGIHNASADLRFKENYKLSIYGRNLTDERYARVVIIPGFTHFGQYNAPRNYGVELTYEF
ncbi:TonB-dependent receptor [Oceanicoccus sp. KOV_DT_Chl]|uniref:TonB-dependent receptor n=1 Tax=Oceanicoccus sp. KOV_DT_Chl TaxID=1904639 RepID=UPI0013590183|nr:TonB-dependent receptor [Oceanicoccus sp. KOV_DT_Chl]